MNSEVTRLKVIITGTTGLVGEGVLLECLQNPSIRQVLMVNRQPFNARDPKLKECLVPDFLALDSVASELTGYNACFYCAGVSSRGMNESTYSHIIYDTTLHFARKLASLNPQMTFIYVSGHLTDSTEKGKIMWARVKGKTENALMTCGFKKVYNFRPGFMKPTPGQQNIKSYYKVIASLYPLLRVLLPNQVSTLQDVATAMIKTAMGGYPKTILETKDINSLAKS